MNGPRTTTAARHPMNGDVVPASLSHVRFSFYTPEQVRQLSVAQITTPIVFDEFMRPVSGGPNDPRLGPMDSKSATCATCGLSFEHCPGHFGHIELPVPVYNPLLFRTCATLLRSCCANCFRFWVSPQMKRQLRRKLRLLRKGDVLAALEVVADDLPRQQQISVNSSLVDTDDEDDNEVDLLQRIDDDGASGTDRFTSHAQAVFRQTVQDFMVYAANRRAHQQCNHCKACSPVLRIELQAMKVFQKPLGSKFDSHNRKEGIRLPSLIDLEFRTQKGDTGRNHVMDDATENVPERGVRVTKYDEDNDDDEAAEGEDQMRSVHEAYISPTETRTMIQRLWANERSLMELMFSIEDDSKGVQSGDMFYMQTIAVPPNNTRPINRVNGNVFEHAQTSHFVQILNSCLALSSLQSTALEEGKGFDPAQVTRACVTLQNDVKALIDHSPGNQTQGGGGMTGIKQRLEKKEGLFRMNMMGKRVNYAARSVISPDPYIATSEIGIPPYFATGLTFPEPVNEHNLESMREAVERGAHVHPGANVLELENGIRVNLARISNFKRKALAKLLSSKISDAQAQSIKKVHRHIRDGDIVLVNRQPTLHKPGIMAHTARILRGEKTIRMHYANCSTYNADFDGDEINIHVPQDFHGRAEAYRIMHADQQYLVPTDGKPIRGLIQDHICAAVLLTKRDTFFTKREFMQLVYNSCSGIASGSRPGVGTSKAASMLVCDPAVLKPRQLWTGKQVLSTIIAHITEGMPPMTHTVATKVPAALWGTSGAEEGKFRIVQNRVVTGVFDKAQFGKFGISHAIHELYGPTASGRFLSALSRLFTYYLQTHGFTCSIEDLFLVRDAEVARAERLQEADIASFDAVKAFMGLSKLVHKPKDRKRVHAALVERLRDRPGDEVALDARSTNHLHPVSSSVVKACLPSGSRVLFPANGMSLMTSSGAKGSNVNFSQISCLLGQQELEGRRVPRMVSGKTLPSFTSFDVRARAGGFVADRFLSGLRPQEYYFHCMAGREGLVDTAVKTSRSGYLQRCLIKSLESLCVHYDSTVRDCDGSIVQFQYGEDGLDVTKTSFMGQHKFYKDNVDAVKANRLMEEAMYETRDMAMPPGLRTELKSFIAAERAAGPPRSARAAKVVGRSDAEFEKLMRMHYTHSLITPGEAVGVLAGQSVGEPSTQMTLNSVDWNTAMVIHWTGTTPPPAPHDAEVGAFIDALIDERPAECQLQPDGKTIYLPLAPGTAIALSPDENGTMMWTELEAVTRHPPINKDGSNTLVEVTTDSGRTVTVTKGKSLLVEREGKLVEIDGDKIALGDRVPVVQELPPAEHQDTLNLRTVFRETEAMFTNTMMEAMEATERDRKWISNGGFKDRSCYGRSDIMREAVKHRPALLDPHQVLLLHGGAFLPMHVPLDRDFGFFVGAYLAEGCATDHQVHIANVDPDFCGAARVWPERHGIKWHVTNEKHQFKNNRTSICIRFHSTILARLMVRTCGKLSAGKRVPGFAFAAPDDFVRGLLDGYISGDGRISNKQAMITASSRSQKLRDGIALLLTRFGIGCRLTQYIAHPHVFWKTGSDGTPTRKVYRDKTPMYHLSIRAQGTRCFAKEVDLVIADKQERCTAILADAKAQKISKHYSTMKTVRLEEIVALNDVESSHEFVYDLTVAQTRNMTAANGLACRDTFHQAGRGEANVTLGIPRLREILMTASRKIATPVMLLPMKAQDEARARKDAEKVVAMLQQLTLAEVVSGMSVSEGLIMNGFGTDTKWEKQYVVQVHLFPKEVYRDKMHISVDNITKKVSELFVPKLKVLLNKEIKKMEKIESQHAVQQTFKAKKNDGKDEADDDTADSDSASDSDDSSTGDESDEEIVVDDDDDDDENERKENDRTRKKKHVAGSNFVDDYADEANEHEEVSESDDVDDAAAISVHEERDEATGRHRKIPTSEKPMKNFIPLHRVESVDVFADRVEVDIRCSLGSPTILLLELVEQCAKDFMVQSIKGIRKCFIIGGGGTGKPLAVQTDGVNFNAVKELDSYIDTTNIMSNDIGAILDTFGVEAARASIVSEVTSVFGVYGINVDRRHLSLISDHMTFEGGYRAFNRIGVSSNASPLLRMSFETAVAFLTNATLHGETDHLKSPSSRIILGKNVELGTGSFSLLYHAVEPHIHGKRN